MESPLSRSCPALLLTLLLIPQEKPELRPGLLGEYYSIGEEIDDFPALKGRKPDLRRIDPAIEFKDTAEGFNGAPFKDHFAVHWTGVIRIATEGVYRFTLDSDDGSRLRIDGKLAVDNGGLHGMGERDGGSVVLKAGDHPLVLDYFENERGAGCILMWTPPGDGKAVVPAEVLFHPLEKEK